MQHPGDPNEVLYRLVSILRNKPTHHYGHEQEPLVGLVEQIESLVALDPVHVIHHRSSEPTQPRATSSQTWNRRFDQGASCRPSHEQEIDILIDRTLSFIIVIPVLGIVLANSCCCCCSSILHPFLHGSFIRFFPLFAFGHCPIYLLEQSSDNSPIS